MAYRTMTRNPGVARLSRSVPQSAAATSSLDPFAAGRRRAATEGLQSKFNTGDINYDAFKTRLDKQKSNLLGGSAGMAALENTGQNVQLAEFGRGETAAQQDYLKDPTKYGVYANILQQHQQAFREDSPLSLQYQSKVDAATRAEQNRMDTQVANQYQTGAFSYTATGNYKDPSTGLDVAAGTALTGFSAYQGYLADQRAKYEAGTSDYIKYDSLIRQNFYAKSFSDILTKIGTTQEGQVEDQIRGLIKNYQPGTPQYDQLTEQLKKVAQNKLDNGWNEFLTKTVYPSIQAAQSKVDLDVTNLVYAMSKGLKLTIDGKAYDFSQGTPQQQQDTFNQLYGSLVEKKNQLANPNNLPQKPVLAFNDANLTYGFEIPGYQNPEYSSRVSYTPPGTGATAPAAQPSANPRQQMIALGGSYLGTMTDVQNAIRAKKNVINTTAGYMVLPNKVLPREQQLTLRNTLSGLGFTYLDSPAAATAARKAGKNVIQAGGDLMIAPK